MLNIILNITLSHTPNDTGMSFLFGCCEVGSAIGAFPLREIWERQAAFFGLKRIFLLTRYSW